MTDRKDQNRQLAEGDAWIGRYREQWRAYLHYVVGMSRFLPRPAVVCRNLASKALSLHIEVQRGDCSP